MNEKYNIGFKVFKNQHNDHNLIDRYLQAYDITPPTILLYDKLFFLLQIFVFLLNSIPSCFK